MTAEEFVRQYENDPYLRLDPDWKKIMVEFAKYHVERALEVASNEADITQERGSSGNWFDCVDKDSILNSYSLDNIK